jgi:hypothetical protein
MLQAAKRADAAFPERSSQPDLDLGSRTDLDGRTGRGDIQTEPFLAGTAGPKPLLVNDAATSWPSEHAPASSRRLTYVAVAGSVDGRVMAFAQVTDSVTNSVTNSAATS